jgi:hypothetical protein
VLIDVNTTFAVLVGVAEHSSGSDLRSIRSVAHNLEDLRTVLMDPAVLGLADDHIDVIHNPAQGDEVGAAVIKAAEAAAGGSLIVYYAGHGMPDENSELYLALTGTRRDSLPWKALPFRNLRTAIRRSPAKYRILVLDCCHAGLGEMDGMAGSDDPIAAGSGIGGAWTLYASSDSEAALAPKGERNTAFTGELLEILRKGVRGEPEELTGDAILAELRLRLGAKGRPRPDQHGSGLGSKVCIARNRAPKIRNKGPVDHTGDAKSQATMLSLSVQWDDEQIQAANALREDERYWVLYAKNSGTMPAHDVEVTVSLPGHPATHPIHFDAIVDGEPRKDYILRPWDGYEFNTEGERPDVEATFTMGGVRWHTRGGIVRRAANEIESHENEVPRPAERPVKKAGTTMPSQSKRAYKRAR